MSFMKGQAVTYIDHEGNQQGALVLVPDNANREATIALVKRDASDATLNSADFHDGLDRKFNIDSTQDRIAKLSDERQGVADATGQAQPAVEYADLTETIFGSSSYELTRQSFTPALKPEEPAPPVSLVGGLTTPEPQAAAAAAGADSTDAPQTEGAEPEKASE